ncbi:MAG: ABC transporter ATP-binding protein [Alphaproteobacteria bacterium]
MTDSILSVRDLSVIFSTPEGDVHAVNNLTFNLDAGQSLAVVGESGSGKSQSFLSMMGLLAKNGRTQGEVIFEGENLIGLKHKELDKIRGDRLAMIFQDPMTSLNPSLTVERQLSEVLTQHQGLNKAQAKEKALEMLKKVGIPEAKKRLKSYPHQLSGGMRQRVMIAMALLCDPKVLIADEPTTALDVTIQAQILDLFVELKEELNTALIMITHDLGVVAGLCDEMMVLYGGRVMEMGKVADIYKNPKHPYTLGLLHSTPNIEKDHQKLEAIAGSPPNLQNLPKGCAFAPRCPFKNERCEQEIPALEAVEEGWVKACFRNDITADMAYKFSEMEQTS